MGYRILRLQGPMLSQFLTKGSRFPTDRGRSIVVTEGLPPGAKLEAVSMDLFFLTDQVALKYSHPSWPDTLPGEAIPEIEVWYSSEDDGVTVVQG